MIPASTKIFCPVIILESSEIKKLTVPVTDFISTKVFKDVLLSFYYKLRNTQTQSLNVQT